VTIKISQLFNPYFLNRTNSWNLWRNVYAGGDDFLRDYLERFSTRESAEDFEVRRKLSPLPTFARSAIIDVRNSIFQRLSNVTRNGGSLNYQKAVRGEGAGVDNRGSAMTSFIGKQVLDELLVMGAVGVYVDAPSENAATLLTDAKHKPYLYTYRVENILNWTKNDPEHPSEYQSITLSESEDTFDDEYGMPNGSRKRTRHVWINPETGKVNVQFHYDNVVDTTPVVELQMTKIPFVFFDLGESLIADAASYQVALLNLWSSNVSYAIQSGFPIFTEQRDSQGVGAHLKKTQNASGTASAGGQAGADTEIKVGVARGRAYAMEAERPGFIHPSSEPLLASMELCDRLKKDIRELINLAVVNMGVQASAESKNMDNSGLEAGLSFIGLVLEAGEREIARHWAAYESTSDANRQIATVAYPQRWSLQSVSEKIKDASDLHAVVSKLPSRSAKKETAKILIKALMENSLGCDTMDLILKEIDAANFTTSDPEVIQMAKEQGLLSAKTGAEALGFDGKEAEIAAEEHVERLTEIAKHQAPPGGIQGVPDTQANPAQDNKQAQATTPDTETETEKQRGKGKI
jgi:hypothetical protein